MKDETQINEATRHLIRLDSIWHDDPMTGERQGSVQVYADPETRTPKVYVSFVQQTWDLIGPFDRMEDAEDALEGAHRVAKQKGSR